jgi:hypothetical protein
MQKSKQGYDSEYTPKINFQIAWASNFMWRVIYLNENKSSWKYHGKK